MTKIYYFDTNDNHSGWWKELSVAGNLLPPLNETILKTYFLKMNEDFINDLKLGIKYFFILHTSESFFKKERISSNMTTWGTIWSLHYSNYYKQINVIFVSGGDPRDIPHIPNKSHYVYGVRLTESNKVKVLREFENAINNLEKGVQYDFGKQISQPYLIALSFHCRGYLGAHSDSDFPLVKEALQQMGWEKLDEADRNRLSVVARNKKDRTEDIKWWKALFGEDKKEDVLAKSNEECGETLPPEISALIDAIYDTTINDPNVVAGAYLQLPAHLKG